MLHNPEQTQVQSKAQFYADEMAAARAFNEMHPFQGGSIPAKPVETTNTTLPGKGNYEILYPKQVELVNAIRRSFAQGKRTPCVQASTGYGKSVVAGYIIRNALDKGSRRVVLIVDSLTLVNQLISTFESMFGLDVGVIQGWNCRFDLSKRVQIATPQTLTRRFADGQFGSTYQSYGVDLLIIDECHLQYKGIREAIQYWGCRAVGFTATPYARGMGKIYDDLVKADPLEKLMQDGDLAKYRAFSHSAPDFSDCTVSSNGDIQADAKYDDGLIGDVFETWNQSWSDRLTIGFATTIAKCEAFAQLFRSKGVYSVAVHSALNSADSESVIQSFRSGEIRVLWSVAKLVKGFDVPEASCLIDCQPTHSLMRHVQKGGRVLRKHPGKVFAVILDHAGNMHRNGLFEDASIDVLSTGKKGETNPDRVSAEPKLMCCPSCKAQVRPAKTCPHCGHENGDKSIHKDPDRIGWKEGELVEFGKKRVAAEAKPATSNRTCSWDEKESFMGGLKHLAAVYGYKDGWAARMYKDRFGVWPNDSRVKNARQRHPNTEVFRAYDAWKKLRQNEKRRASYASKAAAAKGVSV